LQATHTTVSENGVARFSVQGHFEVTLTLDGADLSKPWRVVDARCLAKADPACCRGTLSEATQS
jgi:hypothetical protein